MALVPAEVVYRDGTLAAAVHESGLVQVVRRPITLESLRGLRRAVDAHARRHPDTMCSITVIEPAAAGLQDKATRDEMTAMTLAYKSLGAAIVIEGSGFRSAAIRTVMAGVFLMTTKKYPHKVFNSAMVGAEWLVEITRAGGARISATGMLAAVDAARAAVRL